METGKEMGNELRSAKARFFNVRIPGKKKSKAKADKVIEIIKKKGDEDEVRVKEAMPSPAEVRAQQRAMKPMGKQAVRITPKMPPLR